MEKEQILSTLNEKLGQTSLSERTINDYISENLPAEGTEPDEAYWEKHAKILKSLGGNFSADVAAQVEDFKKNYKPGDQKGQPKEDPKPNKGVEELKRQFEELSKKLTEKETQLTQQQLLAKVKAAMVAKGAEDEYVLKQTLRGVTLDTKKSVPELAEELLKSYDSELTACRGKGAAPRNGGTGGSGKEKNSTDAYWARKQKKEGWGKRPEK